MRVDRAGGPRPDRRAAAPFYDFDFRGPRRTFPGDSGDVADRMGRGISGVRTGDCTWVDGPRGKALRFDGNGQCRFPGLPKPSDFPTIRVRYLSFDFQPIGLFDTAPSTYGTVRQYYPAQFEWTNDNPRFSLGTQAGAWQEVAFRLGARGSLRVVDFFLQGQFVGTYPGDGTDPNWSWTDLTLGSINGQTLFSGLVDRVTIDARPVSDAEILRDFASPGWSRRPRTSPVPLAGTAPPPSPRFRRTSSLRSGTRGSH